MASIVAGVGLGAFAARGLYRAAQSGAWRVWPQRALQLFERTTERLRVGAVDRAGFEAPMTRSEALQILNVPRRATLHEILQKHKKLMVKNHPDSGGSTYLASKVNQAKEMLTKDV